ncbi:MAG TPA: Rne/Rng family ribonuclease [Gemmataceae bacterium]|nr:Rne/Rng family ribonuclease [Gemmataceae bacterium]
MKKEMLINVLQPEECRIAIVEDGVLEELYVERTSQESYVGNIYKGRIVNIEPSIQAAFVDFGIGRNGFLHVSDVEPAYYRHLEGHRYEERGRRDNRGSGGRRPPPPAEESLEDRYPETEAMPDEEGDEETPPAAAAPAAAEAEPERERRPRKGRGRGRGKGRGRRTRRGPRDERSPGEEPSPAGDQPENLDAGGSASADRPAAPEPASEDRPEPPRFMESAERRTEEDEAQGSGESSPSIDDEDIFFPRPGQTARHEPKAAEPESREEESLPAMAPEVEEEPSFHDDDTTLERELEEPEGQAEPADELLEEDEGFFSDPAQTPEETHEQDIRHVDEADDFQEEEEGRYRRRREPMRDQRRGGPRRRMMGRPGAGRPKPLIQDIFRRGQEVLVQVIKEGIGTKGPTLSTYISIAGRYLVLMPGLNRVGVSRKIADDEQRRRLREIFHELQPPKGLGFIIRTAGIDKTKKELQRDLAYLSRLWQVVVRRIKKLKSPAEIYQESDMITRTIRDTFTNDIDTIWVDEPAAFEHAQEFLQIVMPRYATRIKHYTDSEPLFHRYGIENEIARIQQRHVPLPHGGSIVIDQTEALVAIDVNSGNFRADNNAEETAYQMNLHAAREIARQLRLRDLGGVIVNDFIDMREDRHRRDVERALRDAVKRDRARTKILKISQFGLIEMTRQRIRPSLKRSVYQDCPHCRGTSQVKTCESMSIDVMRMLQLAAHRENINRINARVHDDVASYLLNRKRKEITRLEESGELQITITSAGAAVSPEMLEFVCYDNNNNEVKFQAFEESKPRRR